MCLQFTLPEGQGILSIKVRLTGTALVSNAVFLHYAPSMLLTITPEVVSNEGGTFLTITGSNLGIDLLKEYDRRKSLAMPTDFIPTPNSWTRNAVVFDGFGECAVVSVRILCQCCPAPGTVIDTTGIFSLSRARPNIASHFFLNSEHDCI